MLDWILGVPLLPTLLVFVGMGTVFWLIHKFYSEPKMRREAEVAPRITLAEVNSFWGAIEDAALPMAKAKVVEDSDRAGIISQIGGPPLALENEWPKSAHDGRPMFLICQIDFGEVPALPEFPSEGVLQFFSSFEDAGSSISEYEYVVRWSPDTVVTRRLTVPPEILEKKRGNNDFSERTRREGLVLRFENGVALGNPYNYPFNDNDLIYQNRLSENEHVQDILDAWEDRCGSILEGYGVHWIGGHPTFIQEDIRYDPALRALDRVLFHLGPDEDIDLGDSGELNIMISREALVRRDFHQAFLTWDCF